MAPIPSFSTKNQGSHVFRALSVLGAFPGFLHPKPELNPKPRGLNPKPEAHSSYQDALNPTKLI